MKFSDPITSAAKKVSAKIVDEAIEKGHVGSIIPAEMRGLMSESGIRFALMEIVEREILKGVEEMKESHPEWTDAYIVTVMDLWTNSADEWLGTDAAN